MSDLIGLRKVAEQAVTRGVKMPLSGKQVLDLLDRVEKAEGELDLMEQTLDLSKMVEDKVKKKLDRAEQAIARVRELHQETPCDGGCVYGGGAIPSEWGVTGNHCSECTIEPWPCATIRALEGGE